MASGLSTVSVAMDATEQTKKAKKKRSGFGWFKRAFSLSEEEKAAFQEKRKAPQVQQPSYDEYRPQYLDGRRIPEGQRRPGTSRTGTSRMGTASVASSRFQ